MEIFHNSAFRATLFLFVWYSFMYQYLLSQFPNDGFLKCFQHFINKKKTATNVGSLDKYSYYIHLISSHPFPPFKDQIFFIKTKVLKMTNGNHG